MRDRQVADLANGIRTRVEDDQNHVLEAVRYVLTLLLLIKAPLRQVGFSSRRITA